jgi:hypothetical protein
MVYSRAAERAYIREHYVASKSLAAVREAFSNAYPDKQVEELKLSHYMPRRRLGGEEV